MTIVNISAYRFTPLSDLPQLQATLLGVCEALSLKGTILLSTEGINVMVAGSEASIADLEAYFDATPGFHALPYKRSYSDFIPFKRLKVKMKKEIITFEQPEIEPAVHTVKHLSPSTLKQWLDEGKDLILLDTRNRYEIEHGAFEGAVDLGIDNFTDFPAASAARLAELGDKPIVMMCTGGVRCEKAGPLMEKQGHQTVYQLEGGILNYFLECGGAHYRGGCFVFDDRVVVQPPIKE